MIRGLHSGRKLCNATKINFLSALNVSHFALFLVVTANFSDVLAPLVFYFWSIQLGLRLPEMIPYLFSMFYFFTRFFMMLISIFSLFTTQFCRFDSIKDDERE